MLLMIDREQLQEALVETVQPKQVKSRLHMRISNRSGYVCYSIGSAYMFEVLKLNTAKCVLSLLGRDQS